MPLTIIRQDITKMKVDAIVNAANNSLLGGGGVDGAIHRAAGPELLAECWTLNGCNTGEAKITKGYKLPAKYVIHTVGPIYQDGQHGEKLLLESCYRESMKLAREHELESIAFPLISAGVYDYPKDQALQVATDVISEELKMQDMDAYIVVFDKASYRISQELRQDIQEFIDDNYAEECELRRTFHGDLKNSKPLFEAASKDATDTRCEDDSDESEGSFDISELSGSFCGSLSAPKGLNDIIRNLDESFQQMLLRKIGESGMKPPEVYHRANITKAHFSKIKSDVNYRPKKKTVCAFAIALKLDLEDTKELLLAAGYALSHSSKFDVIIEYFISKGKYNIFDINEALFDFDQELLGV